MRVAERDGVLVVRDSPGLHRVLGLLFATVNAVFVLGPVWLFTNRASVSRQVRALSMLMGGAETRAWPLREVAGVRLAEGRDDEGGEVFRVEVVLRSGDGVAISLVWTHGREPAKAVARRLREALAMPQPDGSR